MINPKSYRRLFIRIPDMVDGDEPWEFIELLSVDNSLYGCTMTAKFVDKKWIMDFLDRKVPIYPGDVLEVLLSPDMSDGVYLIMHVNRVIIPVGVVTDESDKVRGYNYNTADWQ